MVIQICIRLYYVSDRTDVTAEDRGSATLPSDGSVGLASPSVLKFNKLTIFRTHSYSLGPARTK